MAELGSIEYSFKVNDEATPDLNKIISAIQAVGKSVNAASAETKTGFTSIGAAIASTENTIRNSNNATIEGLNMLASVMQEVKAEITKGNQALADNGEVLRAIKEEGNAIKETGEKAKETAGLFGNLKEAAKAMGVYFGVQEILSFSKSIVEVRKNMQGLRTSFTTLLGDETKAAQMFNELNEYATATPLQVDDLAKASQTMLGFGIDAEKVIPTLKQIGDISMGDSGKLQSLTLAFSQMSATGKLMGQDLLQMINAGFNPLEEMSKQTGKSIAELKDEMSKGQISAEMVAEAFKGATSEGGKFFGMLDAQSKTMQGAISNFDGAMSNFKDELGSIIEGPLVDAYNAGTKLLAHYQELATAIAMLVTALGAYKAAVILSNAVTKVNAIISAAKAYGSLAKAIQATATAQKALNLAKSLNGWGLLAAGIAAATVALVRYNSAAERRKRLDNEIKEDSAKAAGYASKEEENKVKEDTKVKVSVVFDTSGEKTANQQAEAYNNLISKYKELGETYKNVKEMQKADQGEVLSIIAKADEREQLGSWVKQLQDYNKHIADLKEKQKQLNTGTQGGAAAFNRYQAEINKTAEKIKGVRAQLASWNKARKETEKANQEAKAVEEQNKTIDELKATAGDEEAEVKVRRAALEELKKITKDKQAELEKQVSAAEKAAAKAAQAARKQAEQQRKEQENAKISAFAEQLNNDIAACDKLIDKLDVLQRAREAATAAGGRVGKEETKKTDEALNSMLNASIKSNTDANKDEESALDDRLSEEERFSKQMALLVQERQVVELTADQETRDKQLAIYDNYMQELETRHRTEQQRIYNQDVDNYGTLQQRLAAIDKSYQNDIDAANANGDATTAANLTTNKNQDKLGTINAYIQQMPVAKEAIKDLENVSTEALEIIKQNLTDTQAQIQAAPEAVQGIVDKVEEITDKLSERNPISFAKQLQELKKARDQYEETQRKLKQVQGSSTASAKDLSDAIAANNAAFKNYQKQLKKTKAAAGEWGEALGDLSANLSDVGSQMDNVVGKGIELVASVLSVVSGTCKAMQTVSSEAAASIKAVETASVILAIISLVIQAVQALSAALGNNQVQWADIAETFDNYIDALNEVIDKEKEALEVVTGKEATESYNYIIKQLKEEISVLHEAAEARADYKKQHKNWLSETFSTSAYAANFSKWSDNLTDAQIAAIDDSETGKKILEKVNTQLQNAFVEQGGYSYAENFKQYWKNFYDEISQLSGEELEDLKKNSTEFWASLDSDFQEYLQDIIDKSEELHEVQLSYYESLTDISFDSLKDDFFDTITDMDATAADFAENFSEYMRKAAIKNQLFGSGANSISSELESWYTQFANSLEDDYTLSDTEIEDLNSARDSLYNKAKTTVDAINALFGTTDAQSALSGAISTASQESIDLLAGQTNAVRLNQVEALNVMREQLIALTAISNYSQSSNALLESIDRRLADSSDPLRAIGGGD